MVCPDIGIAHFQSSKNIGKKTFLVDCHITQANTYILSGVFYFGEPVGRVKIQTTSKNSQRYHRTKRLIRYLLSNTPNWYVRESEFRGYLFTGNA